MNYIIRIIYCDMLYTYEKMPKDVVANLVNRVLLPTFDKEEIEFLKRYVIK